MKTRFRGDKTRIGEKTQEDIGVIQKIDDEYPEKAENKLMGIKRYFRKSYQQGLVIDGDCTVLVPLLYA